MQSPGTREAGNLSDRFATHFESFFTFITTPGIEPTNDLAEQAIRFVAKVACIFLSSLDPRHRELASVPLVFDKNIDDRKMHAEKKSTGRSPQEFRGGIPCNDASDPMFLPKNGIKGVDFRPPGPVWYIRTYTPAPPLQGNARGNRNLAPFACRDWTKAASGNQCGTR